MWAHPGKKLLFMGGELAQEQEWSHDARASTGTYSSRAGTRACSGSSATSTTVYRDEPALWEVDFDASGFVWLEAGDRDSNVLAFARLSAGNASVARLRLQLLAGHPPGLPRRASRVAGAWRELLSTDATEYGGSGVGNAGALTAEERPWHDQPWSVELTLPPLGVVWLVPEG